MCVGCKNFSLLNSFGDKPMAAKCSKCRHRFVFLFLLCGLISIDRGRQLYHTKKKLEGANSSTPFVTSTHLAQTSLEQRNQIFLTPPPTLSNGRTISPVQPMSCSPSLPEPLQFPKTPSPVTQPFFSPQSVSCRELLEMPNYVDVYNLTSLLSHVVPLHKPPSGDLPIDTPTPTDGFWDPAAHPLFNLASLSEQLLTPIPSLLSPPTDSSPHSDSPSHERKRKR